MSIAFVVLPHLPGTYLDGAAVLRSDGVPVIAMTLRRDRVDSFWFTLMHELAHVKLHLRADAPVFLDDIELGSSVDFENDADTLASEALIPGDLWEIFNSGAYSSNEDVRALADRAEVHPAIVAGRWQRQNGDFRKFARFLGHGTVQPILEAAGLVPGSA